MTPYNEVFYYVNGILCKWNSKWSYINGYRQWSYKEVLLNGHTGGMAGLEWDKDKFVPANILFI
jgi:hypothetical protein